jgi:hypothetical protein
MAATAGPAVRASHLKDDLAALDELGHAAPRVKARLKATTVAAIEQASRTEHLPVALNLELAEAVSAEAGEKGLRLWGTTSFLRSLDGFFKPLFLGLTKAISPSPGLLFKAFPQGWLTTYRDCGHVVVTHPGAGRTRLTALGLPPELRRADYLTAVCGTLEGAFWISRYEGKATLERWSPASPEASWLVEWRAVKG